MSNEPIINVLVEDISEEEIGKQVKAFQARKFLLDQKIDALMKEDRRILEDIRVLENLQYQNYGAFRKFLEGEIDYLNDFVFDTKGL